MVHILLVWAALLVLHGLMDTYHIHQYFVTHSDDVKHHNFVQISMASHITQT